MTCYRITRCPGCGRLLGVNGSTCVRPSRPAVDLAADSASGDWRERGVPGRRSSEASEPGAPFAEPSVRAKTTPHRSRRGLVPRPVPGG